MLKDNSVRVKKAKEMTEEELEGKIVVGTLADRDRPEFVSELHSITAEQVEIIKKGKKGVL